MMTVLIILLAGIFLGPKQALGISLIFASIILALSYLQFHGIVSVDQGWRQKPNEPADALSYILIFSIIFLLAWLISRENQRSLAKLKAVGQELQQERDQLETKVQERTQTIRLMQREKLEQLQALASIGQLSGGVFHDIVNPLTVVSLNLEEMQREKADSLEQSQTYVQQALKATERISDLIKSVNDRLRRQNQEEYFSLRLEIEEIKKIMESKSKYQQITISFPDGKDAKIKGVRARFGQIIMNILANAIDALLNNNTKIKNINISLTINEEKKIISISIQDNGPGISPDNLPHIFEQFFSTKQADGRNLGLGLSVVKEIVTKDFQGQIKVKSSLEEGSLFTIILPLTS
jgi:signal transduction histidine kinase